MQQVENCSRCGSIFIKTTRSICPQCFKEQEEKYDKVSSFMRKRQNRRATIKEVYEETGVEIELIQQFVREGRLLVSQFPNLSYPCKSCGAEIQEGQLCSNCSDEIKSGLEQHEAEKEFTEQVAESQKAARQRSITYHSLNDRLKKDK